MAPAPGVQLLEVGHRVELVEVEVVAPEHLERLLELGTRSVAVAAERLAPDEESVPYGGDQRTQCHLGPTVLWGDVEMVDTRGHGIGERGRGGVGIGIPEGGPSEHGQRRVVAGPSQSTHVHLVTVVKRCRPRK